MGVSVWASSWLLDRAPAESCLPPDSCDHRSSSSKQSTPSSVSTLSPFSPSHTLSTTSSLNRVNLIHKYSHHGASRSQRLHPPNRHTANTRLPHSPSASCLTRATPSRLLSLPQHPPPPVSTTHCARTNPSTHPTTPRPPSQQSPPHTHWKHVSTTGVPPKTPSR